MSDGLVDAALAAQAVALTEPTLKALLTRPGVSGEQVMPIVVVDPAAVCGAIVAEMITALAQQRARDLRDAGALAVER